MKQKDLMLIGVVVVIAGTLSFVVSSKLFNSPNNKKAQVEVVEPITTEFSDPNKKFFNETSINPTRKIEISNNNNQNPFNNSGQ